MDDFLKEIAAGGDKALQVIYRKYRSEFLVWAQRHYAVSEVDAVDVFQDVVIVFYKNVVSGKITHLESSIKTYLYGIGKNMLLKLVKNKGRVVLVEDMNDPLLNHIDWTVHHESELNERQETIKSVLHQLTEKCLKIIQMFYYKRFSMEAIKENMGYSSEEVARTTKKKCLRKLETIVKKQLSEE